jgi:hypothetical protein
MGARFSKILAPERYLPVTSAQILDALRLHCYEQQALSQHDFSFSEDRTSRVKLSGNCLLVLLALALSSCGPIQSTAYLLDADVQIQAAKTAGADKYAPYEWTAANLYLRKAREEVGYADFEVAVDFAQKASKYANDARERAMSSSKRDELPAPPLPVSPR